ncbi:MULTISPECIES: ABZJ_00895 family protein [unclassified Psychrobacter]|uniref:ABZJ_00895 family protein n=1 Tax=unclassified Psychrobacter TaxID=196806 RepID=UPI0025FA1651|nr:MULTISPECIES: ABZJ_00895 family protein [unclassified Psychrobacter]
MSRKPMQISKSPHPSREAQLGSNTLPTSPSLIKPKMGQYIGYFAIGYTLASAIFMMVQTKIALNSQLVTVLSIIVATYIAVHKFIKHQQRGLDKREINRLMLGGVAVVWLLTMIYFLGIWLFLFDAVSREVLTEMAIQQPLPLLSALVMILVLSLVSARISILLINRLLNPTHSH